MFFRPVVFLHELCHYIPAKLFGLSPTMILHDGHPRVEYNTDSNPFYLLITIFPLLVGLAFAPFIFPLELESALLRNVVTFLFYYWILSCYKDLFQVIRTLLGHT